MKYLRFRWFLTACLISLTYSLRGQVTSDSLTLRDYVLTSPYLDAMQKEMLKAVLSQQSKPKLPHTIYGDFKLLSLEDNYIRLQTSRLSSWALIVLPRAKGQAILAEIEQVDEPTPDSQISFYTSTWQALKREDYIVLPKVKDFLRTKAQQDLLGQALSPLYITISYDKATGLQVTLSVPPLLDDVLRQAQTDAIRVLPPITYRWDKQSFRLKH